MSFEKLFSPIKIRELELRNRVVMSAMGTHESAASEDGRMVTDKLIAYHVARAKGGCGLNTIEVCSVDAASAPTGFLSIADDRYIPGMKKLCSAVHAAGGRVAVQLWQGGLAVASDPQAQILLPSDMPLSPEYTVPGITEERIQSVIEAFGQAARRVVEAGIDVIEFHCAHNYLPHSFLSGGINRRTDGWGGSFENRKKFPLACIQAIRANMPEGMPLFMRIDCQDDMLEGGLTIEEVIDFCKCAGDAGVDVLNISRGNILTAATVYEVAPVDIPHGFNVEPAARIRRETGLLTMPCGRINTPEMAEDILMQDKADLVVMARAQLADPEFCNKAKAGKLNSIKYCIGCDQGCYDYFYYGLNDPKYEHITCMRNPALGEEDTRSLTPTQTPKKVLIAGTESCGKTTLTKCLAKLFNTSWSEEVGRYYAEIYLGGDESIFTDEDFGRMAHLQAEQDYQAMRTANKVCFFDTDAVVTDYYSELYMGHRNKLVEAYINPDRYDVLLYLMPDVAWVSDGMRLNGDQTRRESLNDHLMHMYEEFGFKDKMLVIRGDYNQRLPAAINVVDNMLNLPQK